jgi:Tfp pilus assembly protein PilE
LLGRAQAGFTMLEMVVAMMVLMVGLLALASAVGYALSVSNSGRNVTNTKLLVVSVLEQMENLRNTRELTFGQLANTNEVDNTGSTVAFGGFLAGLQDVTKTPGPDGIYGTADDKTSPGPNGTYGDSDDVPNDSSLVVAGYKRQIAVTVLDTGLKKIEVTLQYPGGDGRVRTMKGSSYLNDDARSNYLR